MSKLLSRLSQSSFEFGSILMVLAIIGCDDKSAERTVKQDSSTATAESSSGDSMASRIDALLKKAPEPAKSDQPAFSLGNDPVSKASDETLAVGKVGGTTDASSGGATAGSETSAAPNSGDINRLVDRLQKLHSSQVDVQSMDQFQQIQIERLEKASQLLELQPTYEFQIMAIKTQIDALSWQDGTKQPGARERLIERCQELLQSENVDFRRMGLLGQTGAFMRRYSQDPSIGVTDLVSSIQQVMAKDFDDFELATELAQTASAIFAMKQRADSIQVMTALRDSLRPSSQLPVIGIVDSLTAQIAMAEVEFDKLIRNQVVDEEKHLPELRAGMEKIVGSGVTVALYNEMTPWMKVFEQQACYRSNGVVAEVLETAYRQLPTDPAVVEVLEALRPVKERMALVGKTLDWSELSDFKGVAFDPRVLQGKVVLVTFFSGNADKNLRDQLQFETKMFEELQDRGFAMVGFNVDNDPNAARDFFGSRLPRWHWLQSSDPARLGYESKFATQTVASQLPYRLLLDREGKVVHLGIPIDRLGKYVTTEMQKSPPPTSN
ncbi:MAG: hypothetical protein JNL67_21955 [Planctomycetaceae bacterium]|nr:hypothetical protein [Planctomycetaceae bacterium]